MSSLRCFPGLHGYSLSLNSAKGIVVSSTASWGGEAGWGWGRRFVFPNPDLNWFHLLGLTLWGAQHLEPHAAEWGLWLSLATGTLLLYLWTRLCSQNVNNDRLGSQLCSLNRTRETLRLGGTIQKDLLTGRCHSPVTICWEIKGFLGEWHGSFRNSCFRNTYARSQIPHFWISSLEWIPFYTTRTFFFFWQMTLNNHTRTKMAKLTLAMFDGFFL